MVCIVNEKDFLWRITVLHTRLANTIEILSLLLVFSLVTYMVCKKKKKEEEEEKNVHWDVAQ